jgi:general secretion pathway protein I
MSAEPCPSNGALKRGFTLLEVLMAIAILGLGLSVLLGAQTGLFANATRTEHISLATGLARCRMSEVELDLLQKGYPLVEADGEGNCCMGESSEGFTCTWKVQRIMMPEMGFGGDGGIEGGLADQDLNLGSGMNLGTSSGGSSTPGPLGLLMQLEATKGQNLGQKPDIGSLATQLQGSMGGVDGLASMVLGMVYPTLKPMLEASIRKVKVSVKWHEGSRERTLDLTQYVTDPKQGNIDQDGGVGMLDGGFGALPGMMGMDPSSGSGLGTGTGTGPGTGTGTTPTLGGGR